jgi:ketosteroid isomerase-like protein
MQTTFQITTKEVLDHHVAAFIETDVEEIMKDYNAGSELLTPQGAVQGLRAIRAFFEEIFKIFPKGSGLDIKQEIIRGNIAYISWTGQSPFVNISMGTDTFVMEGVKILYQTLGAHIVAKP